MPSWKGASRALVIVVDQSGSMEELLPSVHEGCRELARGAEPAAAVHYIAFASHAQSSDDLARLRGVGGGTNIASGFQELCSLAGRWGWPAKLDLVFVSDGEDDSLPRCLDQLGQLPPPGCPCRLFSVGVRSRFPTTLVTDHLYPKFGADSDVTTPPVIPLESKDEAPIVFEQLAEYVHLPAAPAPRLEDFTDASTAEELHAGARRAYNACMHACLFGRGGAEACEPILQRIGQLAMTACEAILRRIGQLAMASAARLRAEARRQQSRLPSQLLGADREVSALDAMRLAHRLRGQVRACLEREARSELLSALDNDAKRNIAGFAARCGTHALKALRYRAVDFGRSKAGLVTALRAYAGSPADRELEDEIGGYTQEEVLLDAQAALPALEAGLNSVIDLLRKLPLVGRTLTMRPVCDGADLNPWLQEVVGLPSTVKLMTTYDLLHTPQGVLNSRALSSAAGPGGAYGSDDDDEAGGWEVADPKRASARDIPAETINHLLLLPGSMGRCGWMHLSATYLLLRNETLFHFDAWLGTMAATVCHLLTLDTGAEWVREELDRVRAAFGAVYGNDNAEGVFSYLAHLQGARFRECLVTAAPALPGWCRCPHLTKYVFGLWLSGTAARWSAPELRKRQLALLVELFHRAGQRPAWRATRRRTPEEWLRAECPLPDAVLGLPTPDQARDVRLAGVTHALAIAPRVSLFADFGLDHAPVQGAACFQFTLASATAMVRGLARLSGLATDCWDLAPARLASVLEAAEVPDNLRRAADARYALALAPADYDRRATAAALRDFTREALEAARSELAVRYPLAAAAAHYSSVPTPLPAEHVAAYRSGHGVDLAEALGLAPTGLSTVACCVPSCPHYLRPLGRPRRGPSGQFALHPRLRAHLDAAGAVPGLHKTAHALQVLDGGDAVVRAHADVVASLVEGGHCLQTDRGPGADKIEAQIRALEDREGGGRQWPERRSRLLAVLREHAEDDAARYRARLLARLAGALRRNGGDEWLTAYVRCVLDRYRAAPFDWAYTDFEAAVMGVI